MRVLIFDDDVRWIARVKKFRGVDMRKEDDYIQRRVSKTYTVEDAQEIQREIDTIVL